MSNSKKITDLAAYTDSQVQPNDLLFITDVAAQETKKITVIDVADYVLSAKTSSIYNGNYNGTFTGSFSGSFSGSFKGNLTGTSSWANNALTASYALAGGSGGGSGEVNTASNIGLGGVGVFKQKSGVDLEFKKIKGINGVSINDDTINDVIVVSVNSTATSPAGSNGNVQFNSPAGTFGADPNLSWDTTNNNKLTVVGNVSSTTFSSSVTNAVGYFGTSSFAISSSNSISSSFAISSSNSISSSFATTASCVTTPNGILSVNNIVDTTSAETTIKYPNYFLGLSKTVTPKSSNSKFLINVSAPILVGGGTGAGWASLFKDNTILVDRFVWSDNGIMYGGTTTYVDTATDLSTRTYSVKYTTSDGDKIYINFGTALGIGIIPSSLSILEINV